MYAGLWNHFGFYRLRRQTQTIGADMFGSVAITQDAIKNGKCEEISDGEESVKSSEKSASIKRCNKTMTTFKVGLSTCAILPLSFLNLLYVCICNDHALVDAFCMCRLLLLVIVLILG